MRAVFFDLDDTLVDHSGAERAAALLFFGSIADRVRAGSDEAFADMWNAVQAQHVDRYLAGEISFQGQRRARIREVVQGDISDSEADEVFAIYLAHYEASWRPFPDVVPCLQALRVPHVAVITNGDSHQQRQKLVATGLRSHLAHVTTSAEVGHAKPDPRIFRIACERAGVTPTDAVHIGDSLSSDYEGALAAGMRAILIVRGDRDPPPDSTLSVVRSLRDVPALIASRETLE